ncbi:hypothetical protein V1291_000964 [Nitrobacteraceae bacterium AZCC 1564]
MDGLIDQLAEKAGVHGYVSIRNVDIGDLQNLSLNPPTNWLGNSGASQSAAGTQHLFQFA